MRRNRDELLEKLWDELGDEPVYEDDEGRLCLVKAWQHFPAGTDTEEIWFWFDENHSKGVGWLMNEREVS